MIRALILIVAESRFLSSWTDRTRLSDQLKRSVNCTL
jgi:hypothetical protein